MGLRVTIPSKSKKSFPDKEAEIRSAGAWDVLNSAIICTSLNEALNGTTLAAAVTARQRNLSLDVFDPHQGAEKNPQSS